jgi:hypothetical protein
MQGKTSLKLETMDSPSHRERICDQVDCIYHTFPFVGLYSLAMCGYGP